MHKLLEGLKIIGGLAPTADAYDGDPETDVVDMGKYDRVVFLLYQVTAGTDTGIATVTVEECDDFTPSNSTAIPFTYYENLSAGTSDDFGAAQTATASGFSTTANKTSIHAIEVKAEDLSEGFPKVRAVLTEGVDDPCTACVLILGGSAKFQGDPNTLPTAIA